MRVLSATEVAQKVPFTTRHIERLVKAGEFPRPIKLGGRRVSWIEEEVDRYIEGLVAVRDQKTA